MKRQSDLFSHNAYFKRLDHQIGNVKYLKNFLKDIGSYFL